jgi:AGCS family alanine or glycine:cation symporter
MNLDSTIWQVIEEWTANFSGFMWGTPLVILLVGGGLYFTLYSRFIPFRYLGHAFQILRGKYDNINDPGQISHFQALSSALASTVGMGNIGGVALAIHTGGPGALFWMWISAIVGMATKYFTCTLSIMYRGKDDQGEIQGGPMYVVEQGLGSKFRPLAILFSVAGLVGCLVLFQANQLSQIVRDLIYSPNQYFVGNQMVGDLTTGIVVAIIVSLVIFGGIRRIGLVASRMVPFMVAIYILAAILILFRHLSEIPFVFITIVQDAFTGDAVLGGSLGSIIIIGIKRAAFSNEAGIGTESMAHGAAKTKEPVREGLVAMVGPFIDTIIVCSITGFVILLSGVNSSDVNGVTLTAMAFEHELGIMGQLLLVVAAISFSLSTMFGYSYYGRNVQVIFSEQNGNPYIMDFM